MAAKSSLLRLLSSGFPHGLPQSLCRCSGCRNWSPEKSSGGVTEYVWPSAAMSAQPLPPIRGYSNTWCAANRNGNRGLGVVSRFEFFFGTQKCSYFQVLYVHVNFLVFVRFCFFLPMTCCPSIAASCLWPRQGADYSSGCHLHTHSVIVIAYFFVPHGALHFRDITRSPKPPRGGAGD